MHFGVGEALGAYLIVVVLAAALVVYLQWRIFAKAGHSGALALIWLSLFVPYLNFVGALAVLGVWTWFAFSEWPVEKRAKAAPSAGAPALDVR